MNRLAKKIRDFFYSKSEEFTIKISAVIDIKNHGELSTQQLESIREIIGQSYSDKKVLRGEIRRIFGDVSEDFQNSLIAVKTDEQKDDRDGIPSDQIYPMW